MTSPTEFAGRRYPAGYDRPVASLARYVLETIEKTYEETAPEELALPPNRLVTIGSVAVDNPLLAVMFGDITVGPPGNEMNTPYAGDNAPRTASLNIELWRRAPSLSPLGNVPSNLAISTAAEAIMQDSWLLLEAVFAADQLGVGVIARVGVNEPNGEMQGVSVALEIQIP